MKYPIINGSIPPMQAVIEYHIVNSRGLVIHTFDDYGIAQSRLNNYGVGCSLVQVTKSLKVLATIKPEGCKPNLHLAISA